MMDRLCWAYIWSPKYEVFHHILASSFLDSQEFELHPWFFPQEAFQTMYSSEKHFFSGISLKEEVLLKELKAHPGQYIVFSDVDLIVDRLPEFRQWLEPYKQNDMTFMRDNFENDIHNVGCCLIHSNERTIAFFETVIQEIQSTGDPDQDVVNRCLSSFQGTVGMFETPFVSQSPMFTNQMIQDQVPYYVIQMLCSNHKLYEQNMYEKLASAIQFVDISAVIPLIPDVVMDALREFAKSRDPNHPLCVDGKN